MTGLATAYYLTRFVPEAKITLYEASGRLGGWVDTEKVAVRGPDGEEKTVLFERGARGIQAQYTQYKWDDLVLYELVSDQPLPSRYAVFRTRKRHRKCSDRRRIDRCARP